MTLTARQSKAAATLEPIGDRILVEPLTAEQSTKSGIILPEAFQEKQHRGTIVALGTGAGSDALEEPLAAGDEVIYSKFGGTELKVEGQSFILLRTADIFCRVHETDADLSTGIKEP